MRNKSKPKSMQNTLADIMETLNILGGNLTIIEMKYRNMTPKGEGTDALNTTLTITVPKDIMLSDVLAGFAKQGIQMGYISENLACIGQKCNGWSMSIAEVK